MGAFWIAPAKEAVVTAVQVRGSVAVCHDLRVSLRAPLASTPWRSVQLTRGLPPSRALSRGETKTLVEA
jgi:hypothetical protein